MKGEGDNDGKKKRIKAKGTTIPLSQLGFKSKVYFGIQTEYTRRRVKYKAARYGVENSKQSFMGRLTFTVDPSTFTHDEIEALPSFKGIKKQQWQKIRQITYHSREQLYCAICLEKDFKAPQMTQCGHVFCWHCIYMHHYKSLKATNCPVCNETFQITEITTCKPIFDRSFHQIEQNRIKLALKCRKEGDKKVYDSVKYEEDLNFARIVKVTAAKVIEIFTQQKSEIEDFLKDCDDQQVKGWIAKVISLSYDKLQKICNIQHKRQYRLHKYERQLNGVIYSTLQQQSNLISFYQQHSGKFIFLHPICDKILRKSQKQLPQIIELQILEWEQTEYNLNTMRKYKQISHIVANQQIDLIIVDLKSIVNEQLYKQFQNQYDQFKLRKQEQLQKEERESERLQIIYEQEKEYMKKLKKMEESEFYDIKVPTTIDLKEIGDNAYFPSLIQTKSSPHPQIQKPPNIYQHKQKEKPKVNVIKESDFPGLVDHTLHQYLAQANKQQIQAPKLAISKSQQPSVTINSWQQFPDLAKKSKKKQEQSPKFSKAGRRKKQKFINVTDQFFQRREQEDD